MLGISGVLIGMSKTGISGVGLMVVPLLANTFGGRPSVGLLLPILIFADIFAVTWYNRHAQWKYILRLLPWAITGIITVNKITFFMQRDELKKKANFDMFNVKVNLTNFILIPNKKL